MLAAVFEFLQDFTVLLYMKPLIFNVNQTQHQKIDLYWIGKAVLSCRKPDGLAVIVSSLMMYTVSQR